MRTKIILIIFLLLVMGLVVVYLWPVPTVPFDRLYAKVDPTQVASLQSFRRNHHSRTIPVDGALWSYVVAGKGSEVILFLHGMTGAYDIWWQQMDILKDQFVMISVTYPAVDSLSALEKGILAILEQEGVQTFNVVGTSLGGYFTQYLIDRLPDRIDRAVFANTFPPNDLIAEKNKFTGKLLPLLPEWLVAAFFRTSFHKSIYPSSGHDELTLAFLNEIGFGRTGKAQLVGRFHCVIEKFTAPKPTMPLMIIESDNDPLVAPTLQEALKSVYPSAGVYTFSGAGHFPYLSRPEEYAKLLSDFFSRT